MNFDLISLLLIAFASQSLFLIFAFATRPLSNRKAVTILIVLLSVILLTNISNIISATYLYRSIPQIAGFARGMVLLLGPCLYFYTLSILKSEFTFRTRQLLHFIPYLVAFIIIRIQESSISSKEFITGVDTLMAGNTLMTFLPTLWLIAYFIHLLIYISLSKREMKKSLKNSLSTYVMSLEQRGKLLKKINKAFILIAAVFLANIGYIVFTGRNTMMGNFFYNICLAFFVYTIAYHTLSDDNVLIAGFKKRYKSSRISQELGDRLLTKLITIFENEKLFINPTLNIATVAKAVGTNPNILSQIINERLNKSFYEFINYYRIEEFIKRINDSENSAYSIIGIAYSVGYNSKSSFNTAFKKQMGTTPSKYIKSSLN